MMRMSLWRQILPAGVLQISADSTGCESVPWTCRNNSQHDQTPVLCLWCDMHHYTASVTADSADITIQLAREDSSECTKGLTKNRVST